MMAGDTKLGRTRSGDARGVSAPNDIGDGAFGCDRHDQCMRVARAPITSRAADAPREILDIRLTRQLSCRPRREEDVQRSLYGTRIGSGRRFIGQVCALLTLMASVRCRHIAGEDADA